MATSSSRKCAQANYHLYLASAKAVAACRELCPDALIGPDVSYPTVLAMTCSPDDVNMAFDMQEMMAFDPMESYCSGHISLGEIRSWQREGVMPEMLPGDEDILAAGTPNFLAVIVLQGISVDKKPLKDHLEAVRPSGRRMALFRIYRQRRSPDSKEQRARIR